MTDFSKTAAPRPGRILGMTFRKSLLVASLALTPAFSQVASDVKALSWIAGDWAGPVGRASSEEHWIAPAGGAMLGVSRTVVKDRMVAFEFLRIEKRPGGIYYVAQPNGRPPTDFKLTQSTPASAVFENPKHDHPKIITYRIEGADTLVARIEGDEDGQHKVQEFRFKRISK